MPDLTVRPEAVHALGKAAEARRRYSRQALTSDRWAALRSHALAISAARSWRIFELTSEDNTHTPEGKQ